MKTMKLSDVLIQLENLYTEQGDLEVMVGVREDEETIIGTITNIGIETFPLENDRIIKYIELS